MRILLTGGAGFIGSAVGGLCIARGHDIAVLDNLSKGRREFVPPDAQFYLQDLNNNLDQVFEDFHPHAVIHQAAHASVVHSFRDPLFDATQNVLGSISLLEACRRHGVKRVVYASSAWVYGEVDSLPARETTPPKPLSPYAASKYAIEHYLRCYGREYGMRSVALRYGNVYGPRQDPFGEAGVVAVFAAQILAGKSPTIYGDGRQTRDFTYVGDVAEANLAAVERNPDGPFPVVFNVSSNRETPILDVFRLMCEETKTSVTPDFGPSRPGDLARSWLDNTAIREQLGWTPKVSLEEGLRLTLDFIRHGAKR
ncbi:MAG: NAD-dependent epimerase/dehydratase family protein [Candidatus Sumerlaeota bacterium]|nr:NAD-dependent epimerase/dehydratase family protein [Candidatus Sumerlaeota bacterium]